MSDPTPATGEAARGIDLDIVERAAHDVRENGLLGCVPGNEHAISTDTVLALVARVRSAEAARDAALARVKYLEAGLREFVILYDDTWGNTEKTDHDLAEQFEPIAIRASRLLLPPPNDKRGRADG